MADGALQLHVEQANTLRQRFLRDHLLDKAADTLRRMNGITFNGGRYDTNPDHIYANQMFSRKLDGLGIDHFAEEYRSNQWEMN